MSAFPHHVILPSPDPGATPGSLRSYRFNRVDKSFGPIITAEWLDGSTWQPVHSVATRARLAELSLEDPLSDSDADRE